MLAAMATVAFLSRGKMHVLVPGGEPRTLESRFGEQIRDRAVRAVQRNAWKAEGFSARFQGRRPQVTDPDLVVGQARVTAVGSGRAPGELLYTLDSGDVSGLFAVHGDDEKRLFHGSGQRVGAPVAHPSADFIACAVARRNGTANIAVMRADGSDLLEVTEGDSLDGAPAWVPGQPTQLLYQSAGVGRDEAGRFRGFGPSSIQRIDFATHEVRAVREEKDRDLVSPRALPDGSVLFIRRPWAGGRRPIGALRATLNLLLVPWYLLRAVWGWLSFFTLRYTGKPLVRAGTPEEEKQDLRQMLIWGNLLDASRDGEEPVDPKRPVAPQSWELVRLRPGGEPEVLAKGVLSFDVGPDGEVVLTDGAAIDQLRADGTRCKLHEGKLVEQVAILPG